MFLELLCVALPPISAPETVVPKTESVLFAFKHSPANRFRKPNVANILCPYALRMSSRKPRAAEPLNPKALNPRP